MNFEIAIAALDSADEAMEKYGKKPCFMCELRCKLFRIDPDCLWCHGTGYITKEDEEGWDMKKATLTIDVYGRRVSGQAPYLVRASRGDGGTPRTYPAESDASVIAWVKQELKRIYMEGDRENRPKGKQHPQISNPADGYIFDCFDCPDVYGLGYMRCDNERKGIGYDFEMSGFPDWCPLPDLA